MPRSRELAALVAQLPRVEREVLDAAESEPTQLAEPQPEQVFLLAAQPELKVMRAPPVSRLPALQRLAEVAEVRPVSAALLEPTAWPQLAELPRVAEEVPAVEAVAADAPPLPSAA